MTLGRRRIPGAILNWSDFAMPVYEFRCNSCNTRKSVFVRSVSQEPTPICDNCGGKDLGRLVSAVAHRRSIQDVWDRSGSQDSPGPDYYKDPRNIGRWTEKRFQEMGMEMPPHIQDVIQASREGELPQPVKELQPRPKEV